MSILIFLIVLYLLVCLTLTKLFAKAGVEPSKAWIPGVNFMEWCDIVGRPRWWAALMLVPIVNIFIYAGLAVDMVRSFGRLAFMDSFWAVIFAPYIFWRTDKDNDKYRGKILTMEAEYAQKMEDAEANNDEATLKKLAFNNPYKKSELREWTEAIVFAVFAASFIRMFLIEAYVIPTSSMEGSLLVGDFLFVSKVNYGVRTPQTVASIPLLHNRLPFDKGESYLRSPSLDYHRLFKFQDIQRNDPVVFNYPMGDSIFMMPGRNVDMAYVRRETKGNKIIEEQLKRKYPFITRPMDKTDFYIKRCVGVAGDSIKIIDGQLHVNGQMATNPTNLQFRYNVTKGGAAVSNDVLDQLNVNLKDEHAANEYHLNKAQVTALQGQGVVVVPVSNDDVTDGIFPHDTTYFKWSADNYGSLYIPKAGVTIQLTPQNLKIYHRVLTTYEGNKVTFKNGKTLINGQEVTSYTFKWNYYWMMGDNRHNSEDSRYWGFVPETHVVGKPLFIWFSLKNGNLMDGIRFGRLFNSAHKM